MPSWSARSRACGPICPRMLSLDSSMTRIRSTNAFSATLCVATTCALLAACNPFSEGTVAERAPEQWPLVQKYCTDCHNGAEFAGELDFEKISPSNIGAHAEQMEMAVRKLRSHAMPPPKEPRPDEQQLVSFIHWLE